VNFAYSQYEGALHSAHRLGKKIYLTINTVFEEREADRMYQLLKYLASVGSDGLIIQDYGIIEMAHSHFPSLRLHASTQMAIAGSRGANFLSGQGFNRVVLARELSLDEIRRVRAKTNVELEVFVHGALCVSASGLCLFSSFLGGKSANRGMCTQACRRIYYPEGAQESGNEAGGDSGLGAYYFSPKDLQVLERLPGLAEAGVSALKIEGRMKSAEYVAAVTSAYRRVLDSLDSSEEAQREALSEARRILQQDFAREKTLYLFDGIDAARETWLNPEQTGGTGVFLGKVLKVRGPSGGQEALIQGKVEAGDSLRFHQADDSQRMVQKVKSVDAASGKFWVSMPQGFGVDDAVYLIQAKAARRSWPQIIPQDLSRYKHSPGRDKAPFITEGRPPRMAAAGKQTRQLPTGLYLQTDRTADLFQIQGDRPDAVILEYNKETAKALLGGAVLPFGKKELILALPPFFPEALDERVSAELHHLVEAGVRSLLLNNPGHLSLARELRETNPGLRLIAGPWLYTFNRRSWKFVWDALLKLGVEPYIVSPLENNRQNLERTVDPSLRPNCLVTLFSYPPLFNLRSDANRDMGYRFKRFYDKQGAPFVLTPGAVRPVAAFSITDKKPFLEKAGFKRFILDISGGNFNKKDYRDLMESVRRTIPLKGTTRFNWKDGFYQPPETA
jgi:putative protease